MTRAQRHATAGSSPLTRGKRGGGLAGGLASGLIPAHAGKTGFEIDLLNAKEAHPRSRGENASEAERNESTQGSSPLTRGKRLPGLQVIERPRLIPAHAGKTPGDVGGTQSMWAHPRSRGENQKALIGGALLRGSSPLTRGKRNRGVTFGLENGLIPAHAGKTPQRLWP